MILLTIARSKWRLWIYHDNYKTCAHSEVLWFCSLSLRHDATTHKITTLLTNVGGHSRLPRPLPTVPTSIQISKQSWIQDGLVKYSTKLSGSAGRNIAERKSILLPDPDSLHLPKLWQEIHIKFKVKDSHIWCPWKIENQKSYVP